MIYNKINVTKDSCFQVNSTSFSLSEAVSSYTLYASISCNSEQDGQEAWTAAEGSVPAGWKAVSSLIPADTQHNIYDNIKGTFYHLVGLAPGEVISLRY